jgi:leishmanolysin-like peptidase
MILAIPRLTNFMRKHYNCSDIRGAIMENEGGEGNKWGHFEKSIFGNEMLTPAKFTDRYVYSMFTFLFLRDTGLSSLEVLYFRFYELNSLTADKPLWGANKSCEFINKRCYSET